MSLLPLLSEILVEADPQAVPVPMLLPGVTDARYFARLGIQGYGFPSMRLFRRASTSRSLIHAADERVPAEEIRWGADRIGEVIERYR